MIPPFVLRAAGLPPSAFQPFTAGLGVGLIASVGAGRALAAIFPGGARGDGRIDYPAFVLVASAVLIVTLFAAYVPARRASRVNPSEALRHD